MNFRKLAANCTAKMELFVISFPDFFEGETAVVSSLLRQYDFIFHLRKPSAKIHEVECFLNEIPAVLHSKIIVHNQVDLLHRFDLKGIHFSTQHRMQANFCPPCEYIGSSCHSLEEINTLAAPINAAYLSPIFPSISKKNYKGNFRPEDIKKFLTDKRSTKVIALGGIHSGNMKPVKRMGFDGMAVLGAIWTNSPEKNIRQLKSNFLQIYKKHEEKHP